METSTISNIFELKLNIFTFEVNGLIAPNMPMSEGKYSQ